jgi:hypothetical protein
VPRASAGVVAGLLLAQIGDAIFDVGKRLVPLVDRFDINRPNGAIAAATQLRYEMTADEATGARDNDKVA